MIKFAMGLLEKENVNIYHCIKALEHSNLNKLHLQLSNYLVALMTIS